MISPSDVMSPWTSFWSYSRIRRGNLPKEAENGSSYVIWRWILDCNGKNSDIIGKNSSLQGPYCSEDRCSKPNRIKALTIWSVRVYKNSQKKFFCLADFLKILSKILSDQVDQKSMSLLVPLTIFYPNSTDTQG